MCSFSQCSNIAGNPLVQKQKVARDLLVLDAAPPVAQPPVVPWTLFSAGRYFSGAPCPKPRVVIIEVQEQESSRSASYVHMMTPIASNFSCGLPAWGKDHL